jgi:hypothetical protein
LVTNRKKAIKLSRGRPTRSVPLSFSSSDMRVQQDVGIDQDHLNSSLRRHSVPRRHCRCLRAWIVQVKRIVFEMPCSSVPAWDCEGHGVARRSQSP